MVNLDMIGYPQSNAPDTLYWVARNTDTSLTSLGIEVTQLYLPDWPVTTTTGCCSDQQSFYNQGYAAVSVFESLSAGNNPNYHRGTDTANTVDYGHVHRLTQASAALIATLGEPSLPIN